MQNNMHIFKMENGRSSQSKSLHTKQIDSDLSKGGNLKHNNEDILDAINEQGKR